MGRLRKKKLIQWGSGAMAAVFYASILLPAVARAQDGSGRAGAAAVPTGSGGSGADAPSNQAPDATGDATGGGTAQNGADLGAIARQRLLERLAHNPSLTPEQRQALLDAAQAIADQRSAQSTAPGKQMAGPNGSPPDGNGSPSDARGKKMAHSSGQSTEPPSGQSSQPPAADPSQATPASLPTGPAKSSVTPQAISLPKAEGSIQGMGESFAPVLSSGAATFTVPIALPSGRNGVQPSLALSYASTNGNSTLGIGWSMQVPFISRQTDKGMPRYVDAPQWAPEEDRFLYNGGQELVPVDTTTMAAVDESGQGYGASAVPQDVVGWQQYRARIEGGFMRFFRSPDATRWVVQGKDGSRFDFGLLPAGEGPAEMVSDSSAALQSEEPGGTGRIYRWLLTRMSDAHGSTVYYKYVEDDGQRYLSDIYYLSPASCANGDGTTPGVAAQRTCAQPLSDYGVHVGLDYEARPDGWSSYVSGWRIKTNWRLKRITVAAASDTPGARYMVRRYHLSYDPNSFDSLLSQVQLEGRPDSYDSMAGAQVNELLDENALGDEIVGRTLPPMRFSYSAAPTDGGSMPGFGGVSGVVHQVEASPPHSVDEARADLYDVNSDGLPDLLVTDPARYRTADGKPAVGVYFNGFQGPNATPAAPVYESGRGPAAIFSQAIPVAIPDSKSNELSLSNANVMPMDVDGDGRSDLLDIPRQDTYGFFTPTREPDPDVESGIISPADQGWAFSYAQVQLGFGVDPRIDMVRDGTFYRTMDVNGDRLIDVVKTTGTEMQTWLNLGWTPGGEGKFGSAYYDDVAGWQQTTDPIESCLLEDGTPVDFSSSEIKLADMNGDGLQDIVKVQPGRVVYWPGRGPGLWGEGAASCDQGEGTGRAIEMWPAPQQVNPDADGVYFEDVNMDGAADLVQVGYNEVDIWFNEAGEGYTDRLVIHNTPEAPAFSPNVRFTDIDGSGTDDLLYADASNWRYIDFMGGRRPRLLVGVENGIGAATTLSYGSSAEDYMGDLYNAASCTQSGGCDRFTWGHVTGACQPVNPDDPNNGDCVYHSGGSPVISTVVRSVETSDQFDELGRQAQVSRTEFAYHDGYYEGIEEEFRGFGAADVRVVGDTSGTTKWTRTYFHQGRRPESIASDRIADNPREALKGRTYLTETFDGNGAYVSTKHATCTVRQLAVGLDGRAVVYAYVSQTDEYLYDHANFPRGAPDPTKTLPGVVYQAVPSSGGAAAATGQVETDTFTLRDDQGYAQLETTTDSVDNVGNILDQKDHGAVHVSDISWSPDTIEKVTEPTVLDDDGQWIWRTARTYIHGSPPLDDTHNVAFSAAGDLLHSYQVATAPETLEFGGDSNGAASYTYTSGSSENVDTSTAYDSWGNATANCGGADLGTDPSACLRYSTVSYDAQYDQLPVSESISTTSSTSLQTTAHWDRGLGALSYVTDPNSQTTYVGYDGLGRLTYIRPPDIGYGNTVPVHHFDYLLASEGSPVSTVYSFTENDTSGTQTIEARTYVDGLGRTRATLTSAGSDKWEKSGVAVLSKRGLPVTQYHASWLSGSDPSPLQAVALPSADSTAASYDAFNRPLTATDEYGTQVMRTAYHSLSKDVWDALDLSNDPTSKDTYSSTYMDGHGRTIFQEERRRDEGDSAIYYDLLDTVYRADDAVTYVHRLESSTDFPSLNLISDNGAYHWTFRTFTYDSLGRRVATSDPDTDSRDPAKDATNGTWRYRFNTVGDLIAVRDPRGCGQNFYYDMVGRLVGEDYVECAEAQTAGHAYTTTIGAGAIADGRTTASQTVDVSYQYDIGAYNTQGRLWDEYDRGSQTFFLYNARGEVSTEYRRAALIAPAGDVPWSMTGDPPSIVRSDGAGDTGAVTYAGAYEFESHSYDHGGRATALTFPGDPNWAALGGTGYAPSVEGLISYDARGLPYHLWAMIGGTAQDIISSIQYSPERQVTDVIYGDTMGGTRTATTSHTDYDARLRPIHVETTRTPFPSQGDELSDPVDSDYTWDDADNLVHVTDDRDPATLPDGLHPSEETIGHDSLYRVTSVAYDYQDTSGNWGDDAATDWRDERVSHQDADPMREQPASMLPTLPAHRVRSLHYSYDWLANMVDWTDDGHSFYERSIGAIANGNHQSGFNPFAGTQNKRPSALYLSTNLDTTAPTTGDTSTDRGGWLWVDYGEGGNVEGLTVRARCHDKDASTLCYDDTSLSTFENRRDFLIASCTCASEQHYEYRWDEVNRLAEARRYDGDGTGTWTLGARQRYLYDGSDERIVRESLAPTATQGVYDEYTALYLYPGDFEERGLHADYTNTTYDADATLGTETQYLIAGARLVWEPGNPNMGELSRVHRFTYALTDLVGSTSAVIDLESGVLTELSSFYPNGAMETYWAQPNVGIAPEPDGFTGKEEDEDVGVTYFGERYLIPRIGRWASPDPMAIHVAAGGEVLNSYHYIGGNLLQGRDPIGLKDHGKGKADSGKQQGNQASSSDNSSNSAPLDLSFVMEINPGSDGSSSSSASSTAAKPSGGNPKQAAQSSSSSKPKRPMGNDIDFMAGLLDSVTTLPKAVVNDEEGNPHLIGYSLTKGAREKNGNNVVNLNSRLYKLGHDLGILGWLVVGSRGGAVGAAADSEEVPVITAEDSAAAEGSAAAEDSTSTQAAGEELNPAQAKNLERFKKKLPSGAKETKIHDLPNGGKAFQADVPGKVPGSKATYEKQVGGDGKTIEYTKTTHDPDGNIVHVKDKIRGTTIQ